MLRVNTAGFSLVLPVTEMQKIRVDETCLCRQLNKVFGGREMYCNFPFILVKSQLEQGFILPPVIVATGLYLNLRFFKKT